MRLGFFLAVSAALHVILFFFWTPELATPALAVSPVGRTLHVTMVARERQEIAPAQPQATPEPAPEPQPTPKPKPIKRVTEPEVAPKKKEQAAPVPPQSGAYTSEVLEEPTLVSSADYLRNTPPQYPDRARRKRQEGTVLLLVSVDQQGRPSSVTVKTSSGYMLLDQAAAGAVSSWRFTPATVSGVPVRSRVIVPIEFRLRS